MLALGVRNAMGGNFNLFSGPDGLDDLLQGNRRARRGIEFGYVVGFADRVAVAVELGQFGGETEELLHPHREVGSIEQPAALSGQGLHLVEVRVPAGSADYHAPAQSQYGAHVLDRGLGRGKVDHRVHSSQGGGGKGRGVFIFRNVERSHRVAAFARHLGNQAAGFPFAQNKKLHDDLYSNC